jgi:AcrR family transcriptional regulator
MSTTEPPVRGRPRVAEAADVAAIALRMFAVEGYEATTMDDVARAAGISRPTLFRLFSSKGDIVWDRYEEEAGELRAELDRAPVDVAPLEWLCRILPRLLRYPDADLDLLRTQVRIIAETPSVQGRARERSSEWMGIIAAFVARRSGMSVDDLLPKVVAQAVWSTGWTTLTHWAAGTDARPDEALDLAFRALRSGFSPDMMRAAQTATATDASSTDPASPIL